MQAHKTEKCYALSQSRTYMFKVAGESKQQIASAIEKEFNVKVDSVRIQIRKGKVQRKMVTKKKAANITKADVRLAFVTLHEGHTIPMFDEPKVDKKAEAKDAKAEKTDKKAAKKEEA